jgi:pre-mRNA-splicing factor 38B
MDNSISSLDLTGSLLPHSTIGKLCRHLLTDIKYYGTMLPRIPVPIAREIEKKMADYDRESKGGSKGGRAAEDRRR